MLIVEENLTSIILLGIGLIILIVFSAFFSASETSYTSVTNFKHESYYKKNNKNWIFKINKILLTKFSMTLSTILIANTLVNTAASTLSTLFFTKILINAGVGNSESIATGLATGVITFLILIFGEYIPKAFARKHSISFIKFAAPLIYSLYIILYPINWILNKLIKPKNDKSATEQEIDTLVNIVSSEGVLETSEASLVSNSLKFDETKISSVLTKKSSIIFANYDDDKEKILNLFIESKYTRLPIKKNNNIIGFIDLKSFIKCFNKDALIFDINEIIKPILKISQYQSLDQILRQMQISQTHIALVKKNNNSSQIIGMVTMEDIIEFLVGEIEDEHDENNPITKINDFTWKVNGNYNASKFIREIIKLPIEINKEFKIKQWISNEFNVNKFKNNEQFTNEYFKTTVHLKKNELFFVFERKKRN